jgi:hypothetical protein
MNMDNELRDALRRKEAPHDLADRVLARINAGTGATKPRPGSTGSNVRRWLAAAAVVAVAAGGAERYYTQQQEAAEAARVRKTFELHCRSPTTRSHTCRASFRNRPTTAAGKGYP